MWDRVASKCRSEASLKAHIQLDTELQRDQSAFCSFVMILLSHGVEMHRIQSILDDATDCTESRKEIFRHWVLAATSTSTGSSGADAAARAGRIFCWLCGDCRSALSQFPPKMPWKARARGMWHGPSVPCLEVPCSLRMYISTEYGYGKHPRYRIA